MDLFTAGSCLSNVSSARTKANPHRRLLARYRLFPQSSLEAFNEFFQSYSHRGAEIAQFDDVYPSFPTFAFAYKRLGLS